VLSSFRERHYSRYSFSRFPAGLTFIVMAVRTVIIFLYSVMCGGAVQAAPESSAGAKSAGETIKGLDTDGNGRVNLDEITAFARKNGLDAQEVGTDFHDLDSNSDGELDAQEISGLFGTPSAPEAPETAVASAPAKAPKAVDVASSSSAAIVSSTAAEAPEAHPAPASRLPETAVSKDLEKDPQLSSQSSSHDDLVPGLDALKLDADRQAGGVLAEGLAKHAESLLKQGEKDRDDAVSFEAKARSLRGSAKDAAKSLGTAAREASRKAVSVLAQHGLLEAHRLQLEAEEYEKKALEHHQRASQALSRASASQA